MEQRSLDNEKMAPPNSKPVLGNVIVIGGCGFLGHHIVNLLVSSYTCKVSVIDVRTTRNRRPESDGVGYFDGDISSMDSILPIFEKTRPDVVIHTASPMAVDDADKRQKALYYKVNVEGTRRVIEACQKTGVKALVYTSSSSVVSDGKSDLIHANETWPVTPVAYQPDPYSQTKAQAESIVLAANRSTSGLLTVSIRPAGIFGEGDVQNIPNFYNAYATGKDKFQLGDNTNLFDFTYVGNIADAHALAATALLYTHTLKTAPLDHERVDGEAFFITNDEPIYFWDYARAIFRAAGSTRGTDHVWVISKDTGLVIGGILQWGMGLVGKKPKLTVKQVQNSCLTRYFDCSKAKQRLGYNPRVKLADGIKRAVKYHMDQLAAEEAKKVQ